MIPFRGYDIPAGLILVLAVALVGINAYTEGAITDPIWGLGDTISSWTHKAPAEKPAPPTGNDTEQTLYKVEGADGSVMKTTTLPSDNYYTLGEDGVYHPRKTTDKKPGADRYGVVPLTTLVQDASAYANLVARLKSQYPGYTLKEYDRQRMRLATEQWLDDMFNAVETFAGTGSHADEWNSQTRKEELDNSVTLYLFKANGNGWDLLVPATMKADETDTQAVEMKAFSSVIADFNGIPTSAPTVDTGSKDTESGNGQSVYSGRSFGGQGASTASSQPATVGYSGRTFGK
jgi:hypothetical protein